MQLKPCPFCGSEKVWISISECQGIGRECYCVYCDSCFACGPEVVSSNGTEARVKVTELWNKRKIPNVPYAEVLVEWMRDSEFSDCYWELNKVWERVVELVVEEEMSGT